MLARIQNAGAIFLGPHSPVSLGDYAAGSNHVLPTGGQARFAAGLNAATFLRSQQVVEYTPRGPGRRRRVDRRAVGDRGAAGPRRRRGGALQLRAPRRWTEGGIRCP